MTKTHNRRAYRPSFFYVHHEQPLATASRNVALYSVPVAYVGHVRHQASRTARYILKQKRKIAPTSGRKHGYAELCLANSAPGMKPETDPASCVPMWARSQRKTATHKENM